MKRKLILTLPEELAKKLHAKSKSLGIHSNEIVRFYLSQALSEGKYVEKTEDENEEVA